jgi:phage tail tape-measure protein
MTGRSVSPAVRAVHDVSPRIDERRSSVRRLHRSSSTERGAPPTKGIAMSKQEFQSIESKDLNAVTGAGPIGAFAGGIAGSAGGHWLGNRIAGPVGGAVGGFVGGWAGRIAGSFLPI